MNTSLKLIVPLIDKNLTKEDIDPKTGFVGVYDSDINRPYLDNHIFLVYDASVTTAEAYNRIKKFNTLKTIGTKYCITIKGKRYMVYAFMRNVSTKKIYYRQNVFTENEMMQIIRFHKLEDNDINKIMLDPINALYIKHVKQSIQEEDYGSSLDEKKRSIEINRCSA